MENIEEFLLDNCFELYSYYGSAKQYKKQIDGNQYLLVRIFSESNKISYVDYHDSYDDSSINLETIQSLKQLKLLLQALDEKNI